MRDIRWASLSLLLSACATGFDPKGAAEGARVTDAPAASSGTTAKQAAPPCEPCAEPFAIAEVAFDIDVFERPPAFSKPVDAKLEIGRTYGSVGTGPNAKSFAEHYASITYAGDSDVFDRDIAAPLRAAVKMPPQTWLAFDRQANMLTHAAEYHSVVLRQPFLVTSADVVSARAAEHAKVVIHLDDKPSQTPPKESATYAVEVTLADAAAERAAAWAEKHPMYPLAYVVHGRVLEHGHMTGRDKQLWLNLEWLAPKDTQAAAEKLAKEISERSGKR